MVENSLQDNYINLVSFYLHSTAIFSALFIQLHLENNIDWQNQENVKIAVITEISQSTR